MRTWSANKIYTIFIILLDSCQTSTLHTAPPWTQAIFSPLFTCKIFTATAGISQTLGSGRLCRLAIPRSKVLTPGRSHATTLTHSLFFLPICLLLSLPCCCLPCWPPTSYMFTWAKSNERFVVGWYSVTEETRRQLRCTTFSAKRPDAHTKASCIEAFSARLLSLSWLT